MYRVLFAVNLELADFNKEEIQTLFRPCFLDPGRKTAYTAHYGENEVRSPSTTHYYHAWKYS